MQLLIYNIRKMRAFIVVSVLIAVAHGCVTPDKWEAKEISVDPGRGYDIYNHIHYDAPDKYIARFEDISGPRPGHDRFDEVDHFRQSSANGSRPGMEYRLNYETKQCFERPLEEDFRPIEIPSGAKLLAEYVIGLEGTDAKPQLKVLTYGLTAPGGRRIIASATKTGCIPVHLTEFSGGQRPGFISSSFFNVTAGIADMSVFNKPEGCR